MPKKAPQKKPENSGKIQEIKRLPNGRFPKGVSGNPEGPKPGYKQSGVKAMFKEMIQRIHDSTDKSFQELWVERMIKTLIEGDTALSKMWVEQLEGSPSKQIFNNVSGILATTPVSNAKAKKLVQEFNAALRAELNKDDYDEEKEN